MTNPIRAEKPCSKCGVVKPIADYSTDSRANDGRASQCRKCNASYSIAWAKARRDHINARKREWRKSNPEKVLMETHVNRGKAPEKYKARTALFNAVKAGKVQKKPCERCGSVKSQGHHNDYSKPLDVIWLCPVHHAEIHKNNKGE